MILGMMAAMMIGNTNIYPRAMEIVEIDTKADEVVCVDALGYEWSFYEADDLEVGDLIICMIDNKGTATFSDDEIVDVWYSGYTMGSFYKPLGVRVIDI